MPCVPPPSFSCFQLALAVCISTCAAASETAVVGKSEWLYYQREWPAEDTTPGTAETVRSLVRLAQIYADNQIALSVVLTPTKARVYPEHLPDTHRLSSALQARYSQALSQLRLRGVHAVDLEGPFLSAPNRLGDQPLFYRLDTHWSQSGALLAAQALQASWRQSPVFQRVLTQTSEAAFELNPTRRRRPSAGRDLIGMLPPGSPAFGVEEIRPIVVTRKPLEAGSLLGAAPTPGIALVGSSYSKDWTGFADYLRHALQRDIVNHSIDATQGPWVATLRFLRDEGFQSSTPRAVILELPERDLHAAPDFHFREMRYRYRADDWALQAAAWAQRNCLPAPAVRWRLVPGISAPRVEQQGEGVVLHRPRPEDMIELEWTGVSPHAHYFEAQVSAPGATAVEVERVNDKGAHRESIRLGSDLARSVLRSPLTWADQAVQRLRVRAPGATRLELSAIQPCRHPRDYLSVH